MRLLRWERATVGMAPPRMAASDELSGRRTYLSERSCTHTINVSMTIFFLNGLSKIS